jgi:N,N'-diacetyllegionaminate synthase
MIYLKPVKLLDKYVGDGYPCYTIAEIGGAFTNFEEAKRLIDSALEMNVDAVKFQTLEADTITTKKNYFDLETTGNITQYELFRHFELDKQLQKDIVKYANNKGVPIFSAPSHMQDLKIMKEMDLAIYKIGSDLACHVPLLREIAKLGKPIILSTGMCNLDEVVDSVNAIKNEGNDQIVVMHCISNYPSKFEELNLNAIQTMKEKLDVPVGFSDHTIGTLSTLTSVAMGANMIERHFRDPNNPPGPDDAHSLLKDEFAELISSIRLIESSYGSGEKIPTESEKHHLKTNRISIVAMEDIPANTIIKKEMIDIRRPGYGIPPKFFDEIIGKKTKIDVPNEEPLKWEMLE